MAKEGSEDVYGTFNMLMRRKVGAPRPWHPGSASVGVRQPPGCAWPWHLVVSGSIWPWPSPPAAPPLSAQAKENNFKAVLESIRDLMNEDCVLPPWLHDILLGYGDPGAAQYKHMDGCLQTVDFKDTFLDAGAPPPPPPPQACTLDLQPRL